MLIKSFELLEAFREYPKGLTYPELVRLYPQFSRVSIFRMLCSLEQALFLERAYNSNSYVLGTKFIELGRIAESRLGLVEVALPHMEKLLSQFDENVNLGTVQNFELVYFKTLESGHVLRVHEMPNRRIAVYCSALGKAALAHMGEEAVQKYLRTTPLTRLTPTTTSSAAEFQKELKAIRERGYALDNEENFQGVRCVAAPILDGQGRPLAGLSISGPSTRMTDDRLVEMARALKQACAAVRARFASRAAV
jgi:DNA-binding IclR family transcriptional regulator